ncbi:hypothetical protein CR513_03670, partial [Mucuna pruriens]
MDVYNNFVKKDKYKVTLGIVGMIFDQYLAVTNWNPTFASPSVKVEHTSVRIRFPSLNLVFYNESFLLEMASMVEKGWYARFYVEIDLTQLVETRGCTSCVLHVNATDIWQGPNFQHHHNNKNEPHNKRLTIAAMKRPTWRLNW